MQILEGQVLVYHLYELADIIDIQGIQKAWEKTTVSRLVSRRPSPDYLQFTHPPVVQDLGTVLVAMGDKEYMAQARAKVFDFGVVSITLSFPSPKNLDDLLAFVATLSGCASLEAVTRSLLARLRPQLDPYLKNPHQTNLMEDYQVTYLRRFEDAITAEKLLDDHRTLLAQILRGERKPLSRKEQDEALREHISYFEDDVAIINWNSAFVYDREGGSEHIDVIEFANAELLELRYYDGLLDREMDRIYDIAQRPTHWWESWRRRAYRNASQKLMAQTVDVIELVDNIENALKITGELYSSRIYRSIARRLSLQEWESNIDQKLKTAHQVYQMLIDQVNVSHSNLLEWIVILLIALETILFVISSH